MFNNLFKTISLFILFALLPQFSIAEVANFKHRGYVMARGPILGPNDQPILVEVDQYGEELQEIGEVHGALEGVVPTSAVDYQARVESFKLFKENADPGLIKGALVLSTVSENLVAKSEYKSYCESLPQIEVASPVAGEPPVKKDVPCPDVNSSTIKSVYFRSSDTIVDPDVLGPEGPILFQSTIDLRNYEDLSESASDSYVTVLLKKNGDIAREAKGGLFRNTVTYKWGEFLEDGEGGEKASRTLFNQETHDAVIKPIPGVRVFNSLANEVSVTTGEYGEYRLNMYLPVWDCDSFSFDGQMIAEIPYRNFNPKTKNILSTGFYNAVANTYDYYIPTNFDFCYGWSPAYQRQRANVVAILATIAVPIKSRTDLRVDSIILTGEGSIDVEVESTAYDQERAPVQEIDPANNVLHYDFDGDRNLDIAVLYQGKYYVYLGGRPPKYDTEVPDKPIEEDLVRLADHLPDFQDRGLLKSISLEDLQQTDIYVFRASTGQLIHERIGLEEEEFQPFNIVGADEENTESANFYYKFLIRGPTFLERHTGSLEDWWSKTGIKIELFEGRKADYLRMGERVQIVAVNRATGYVGSVTSVLEHSQLDQGTSIAVDISKLVLRPPNLKIRAERTSRTELGLDKGEINRYLIGGEGSALSDDTYIKIDTEWFDHDGNTLPSELPGYSAMLAKVVSPGKLAKDAACGSQLNTIEIKPGVHPQLLKLSGSCDLQNEHYYLYVCGHNIDSEGKDQCFNFNGEGGRPSVYVPVQVPVYDEIATRQRQNAHEYARQDDLLSEAERNREPEPVYRWAYRPEMQFSVYGLKVDAVNSYDVDGAPQYLDLRGERVAEIGAQSTSHVEVLHDLLTSPNGPLSLFSPDKKLVFALGEHEIEATAGEFNRVVFDNIEHLSSLSASDHITLRLFDNNDTHNILWQYTFSPDYSGRSTFTRSYMRGVDTIASRVGSYRIYDVDVESPSKVTVKLYDHEERFERDLIGETDMDAGVHQFLMTREDLEEFVPRAGETDLHMRVIVTPDNGDPEVVVQYKIELNESISGDLLGQIIEHDTLIQRGALSIQRQDISLEGLGPQLNFIRSYSNEAKIENSQGVIGPGWTHNHNLFVQVMRYSDGNQPYGDNLPSWVKDTRDELDDEKPKLLLKAEMEALKTQAVYPSLVTVSNGGIFYRTTLASDWVPQRGRHGELTTNEDGFWLYRSKDGTEYHFEQFDEAKSRLMLDRVVDRNGNTLTYEYTSLGGEKLVSTVTDATGRTLNFRYGIHNYAPRLETVSSSVGIQLNFEYFPNGDPMAGFLKSFNREDFVESYEYEVVNPDPAPNLVAVTDANGRRQSYEYFPWNGSPAHMRARVPGLVPSDLVRKVTYPGGDVAEIKYPEGSDNVREVVDLRGNTTRYTLNAHGNPTLIEEPEGRVTEFDWSVDLGEPDNVMRRKKDRSIDAEWSYEYDVKGNLTKETDPFNNSMIQSWDQRFSVLLTRKDKNGVEYSQTLDDKGNVTATTLSQKVIGEAGGSGSTINESASYDSKGQKLTSTDGRGNVTTYKYDVYGYLKEKKEALGSVTSYQYTDRGLMTQSTDPNGNISRFEYDKLDRLTKKIDPVGNTVEYVYDKKGNKLSETSRDSYLDQSRRLFLSYQYDERDRVVSVTRQGSNNTENYDGRMRYSYDANSNVLRESDWKGQFTEHEYDDLNRRTQTTNALGDDMSYAYEFTSSGLRKTMVDYEGRTTVEQMDKLGRKTSVALPLSFSRSYEYDKTQNLLAQTDENGNRTRFSYNERYQKIAQLDALDGVYLWEYDDAGNLSATVDEEGRRSTYTYDDQNRMTASTDAAGRDSTYGYDANGNLTSETRPYDFAFSYRYNALNQQVGITNPDGGEESKTYTNDGLLVRHQDAEGRTNTMVYGPEQRLYESTDPVGRKTAQSFDLNGNVLTTTLSQSGEGPLTSSNKAYTYDALNRKLSVNEANIRTTNWEYDKVGNVLKVTRPNGRETSSSYDDLNRVLTLTDAKGGITRQSYDGVGNVLSRTDRRNFTYSTEYDALHRPTLKTDPLSQTERLVYDKVGNITQLTDKRDIVTTTTYDGINRPLVETRGGIRLSTRSYAGSGGRETQTLVDANDNTFVTEKDFRGNTLSLTFADSSVQKQRYDLSGFMTEEEDESGFITRYNYFADGRVASSQNPEGETTSYRYDLFGNQRQMTRPLGAVQHRDYDALNRLVRVSDALNQQTQFQYDANDNLLVQTMPGSAPVNFTYDVLNRQLSREHGSLTSSYEYDAEGNLTKTTDPKGQVFSQQFDQLGRLQQQDFPSGSDLSSVTTSYDGNNNPLSVSETTNRGTELYSYAYDTLDRLTRSEQRGQVLTYQYDNNGNRTQLVSPGGSSDYRYDNRNRLSEVQSGSEISRYHYLANSWLERVENANGSQVAYQYDNAGRVVDIQNSLAGGGLLSSFAYQYDNNGNRTQQIEVQNGFADTQSLTTTYSYDTLDRLTSYTENDGSDTKETIYTYFPSYDRKSETVTVGSQTERQRQYVYDNINRLTSISEAAGGEISYLYDRNGNQLSRTDTIDGANDSTLFTYNSRNQLTQVQNGAPGSEASQGQNHYDYRGMRIRQLGSSRGDIEYLYDQKSIVDELQSGSTLAHYTYGDRLLSLNHSGESQFYHYAALGTTANLSDSAGQVKVSYRSDVFGSISKQEGTSVNRQVFTGQEHDENTGLIYFGARFYDPAIGRFMTQDTYLGESNTPPSLHRYLYAYSNPTVYIDLHGYKSVFGDANEQLDNFNDYLDKQNESADNAGAAVAIGVTKAVVKLGQSLNGALDTAANLAQVAAGVDDQQVRDELAATRGAVTNAIDFALNADKTAAVKNLHQQAVDRTSQAFSGDVSAIADVSGAVSGAAAGLRPGGMPRINRGPTVVGTAKAAAQTAQSIAKSKVVSSAVATAEKAITSGGEAVSKLAGAAAVGAKEAVGKVAQSLKSFRKTNVPDTTQLSRGEALRQKYSHLSSSERRAVINERLEGYAANRLDALEQSIPGAHFKGRHGAQTTLSDQFERAVNGIDPVTQQARYRRNGNLVTPNSTRFLSHRDQYNAIQRATTIYQNTGSKVLAERPIIFRSQAGEGFYGGTGAYDTSFSAQVWFNRNAEPITAFPILGQ
ncbi:hypothetical protein NBRC116587_16160 [Pseudoteredinibacter isoporae]